MIYSNWIKGFCPHFKLFTTSSVFLIFLSFSLANLSARTLDAVRKSKQIDLVCAKLENPQIRQQIVEELAKKNSDAKKTAWAIALNQGWSPKGKINDVLYELIAIKDGLVYMYVTDNVNSAISIAVDPIRNTPPYNLNGTGVTVGIWDGGSIRATHQEFNGRVNVVDGGSNYNHATHVGGTVGATGIDSSALGMAPNVTINSYEWNYDASEMTSCAMSYAGEPGTIQVSNHSYGIVSGWEYSFLPPRWYGTWGNRESEYFGIYNSYAAGWDMVCYDAPYFLPFKSAGNNRSDVAPSEGATFEYYDDGWQTKTYNSSTDPCSDNWDNGGFDTINAHGNAKNIMTVGAVDDAVSGGSRDPASGIMTNFSGWGPSDDGRIKPDIVANGVCLYSSTANSDASYSTKSGTSMSSPSAAGAAILLVEYYGKLFPGQAMRSSTLKGLIIHTADDLGNTGPDYSYGWGLVNVEAAAVLIKEHHNYLSTSKIIESVLNENNPNDIYEFVWDGSSPVRLTLCWTDPPAMPLTSMDDPSPRLVNDLDIRIIGPNGSPVFYPYILDPTNPSGIATTGDNTLDNIEQIYITSSGIAGTYTVKIAYKGILTNNEQYYSLISSMPLNDLPPTALDSTVDTRLGIPQTINLNASDEGHPNPPGILTYVIESLPEQGILEDPCAGVISSNDVPYTLVDNGNQVVFTANMCHTGFDSFDFKANDGGTIPNGGESNIATISLNIVSTIYTANMDTDTGWIFDSGVGASKWEWGVPTGSGGEYGNSDPAFGFTDSNVIGYNLSGDYRNDIILTEWAKTPVIDCSNYINVKLIFCRWLNVEWSLYDHAYIEASNNGSNWERIWENTAEITDSSWILQTLDISTIADGQSTVFIRWGTGPTDYSARYSGWNIDDVEITGVKLSEPITGDFKPDCNVDLQDFAIFALAWLSSPGDDNWNQICDISEPNDNFINEFDLDVFCRSWLNGVSQ